MARRRLREVPVPSQRVHADIPADPLADRVGVAHHEQELRVLEVPDQLPHVQQERRGLGEEHRGGRVARPSLEVPCLAGAGPVVEGRVRKDVDEAPVRAPDHAARRPRVGPAKPSMRWPSRSRFQVARQVASAFCRKVEPLLLGQIPNRWVGTVRAGSWRRRTPGSSAGSCLAGHLPGRRHRGSAIMRCGSASSPAEGPMPARGSNRHTASCCPLRRPSGRGNGSTRRATG